MLAILLPLAAAVLTYRFPFGKRYSGAVFAAASAPAVYLGIAEVPEIASDWFILGAHFALDSPRRILLLLTGILWGISGLFSQSYMKDDKKKGTFNLFFGAAMAGNFGLLTAADVVTFYTFFALMTFASYGLVIHNKTPSAVKAARVYLVMAVIGELFIISALFAAVQCAGSTLTADIPPALAGAENGRLIFLLGLVGFGVKAGMIPLYFWLPLAHPAAPAPASAVLSGAMIKAGLVGWMHLAPVGLAAWPAVSLLMAGLGFAAALGAAIVGFVQSDPKTNLAYSSISQMGLMTAFLGAGLNGNIPADVLLPAIALYAFNHGTAKALLFLGTALPGSTGGRLRIFMWLGLGAAASAIAGAPLTGGMWTKYLLKNFLGEAALPGARTFLLLLSLSAVTTTLLLGRFLYLAGQTAPPEKAKVPPFFLPWALLLAAGGLWTMSPALLPEGFANEVLKGKKMTAFFLNPRTVLNSLWPILLGAGGLAAAYTFKPSLRAPHAKDKPLLPPGDILFVLLRVGEIFEKQINKAIGWLRAFADTRHSAEKIMYKFTDNEKIIRISTRAEALLRRWEVVGISFFIFFLALFFLLR